MASSILFIFTDPLSSRLLRSPNENWLHSVFATRLCDRLCSDRPCVDVPILFILIMSLMDNIVGFFLPPWPALPLLRAPTSCVLGVYLLLTKYDSLSSGEPKFGALWLYNTTLVLFTLRSLGLASISGRVLFENAVDRLLKTFTWKSKSCSNIFWTSRSRTSIAYLE